MTNLLEKYGPWALITGASSGIGREIALQLGDQGFRLILTGRHEEALTELAGRFEGSVVVVADLSPEAGATALLECCGSFDIGLVVLNAEFGTSGSFGQTPLEDEIEMLRLNCEAPFRIAYAFRSRLEARGGRGDHLPIVNCRMARRGRTSALFGHQGLCSEPCGRLSHRVPSTRN